MRITTWLGIFLAMTAMFAVVSVLVPDPLPAQTKVASCQIFPTYSETRQPSTNTLKAWNQNIKRSPLAENSRKTINFINKNGGDNLHPDFGSFRKYGIPFVVGSRNKQVAVDFKAYKEESDKGPYHIPLNAPIEGGKNSDGDRHVIYLDKRDCKLEELYNAHPSKNKWTADSGVVWNLRKSKLRREGFTSADAAGLPIFPGLVRYGEVKRGQINHAVRMTFDLTRNAYLKPATHCAGKTNNPNAPAMGTRLRLKPSYSLQKFSGQSLVIVRALKKYGALVADNGSNWYFGGAPSPHWNDDNLNQLKEIEGKDFQVVESKANVHVCN